MQRCVFNYLVQGLLYIGVGGGIVVCGVGETLGL